MNFHELGLSAITVNNAKEFGFNAFIAGACAALSAWFGGWDIALKILLFLMVTDYVTGLLGAARHKKVNSEVMLWGGIRKILVLGVVAFAVLIDQWLGNPDPVIRTLAIYFYAGREGLSVTENLGIIGVPLPPWITSVLEQLQKKGMPK